jgi:cysteine-rich repeat protein
MKTSIAIATFLVVGAGAAGVGASLPSPYQGSDTLFNVTTQAIAAAGLTPSTAYVGGGSGNGQSAMVGGTQTTAPMSRMLNSGASICTSTTHLPSGTVNAAGVVIGLDAVDILASTQSGGAAACNGTADGTGTGLAYSNATNGFGTWKDVLALVYGGKDNSTGTVDCNSTKRQQVVASWSNLYQNGCSNGAAVCGDATHGGALWHAFRRDDASGTSDVFASVLGLSPSTSASANNGFGTSPYCNAMNWDTSAANANCALGANKQWTGPGGVPDPTANDGVHRRPPPGTWGDAPDPSSGALGADVLPTSMQDNDPIRRPCQGGTTNNPARAGEEVCNINGTLGLVVPVPASDFIPKENPGLVQYPTNNCTGGFVSGKAPQVFTCAIRGTGTKHNGECPNGDALQGNQCQVPIDANNNTSQCVATKATVAHFASRNVSTADGRAFNLNMRDGTTTDGSVGYVQQHITTATGTLSLDFVGGHSRIHQVETAVAGLTKCQLVDASDQIGCIAQADPCSIGFAGDTGKTWGQRAPGGAVASNVDAARVNQVYPTTATVQALGEANEYPLGRKLYFNSILGFASAQADELALGQFESIATNINPILVGTGFFTLGALSPMGTDTPFCEDFNQQTVCGAASNDNACTRNPSGIPGETGADSVNNPTQSTICGNGKREAFEECDDGATNGKSGDACSTTCRFVH